MAQGLRVRMRRAAWTGFGLLLCGGLVGCMNDDKRLFNPPTVKGTNPANRTTMPTNPGGTGNGGIGMQPGGGQPMGVPAQPGGRPVNNAGPINSLGANPYNTGGINPPTTPGVVGAGGPLPAGNNVIPQVGPTSNYMPASAAPYQVQPASHHSPSAGVNHTTDPPSSPMTDTGPVPPSAPGSGFGGVSVQPPVVPAQPLPPGDAPPGLGK